jgi:hypothetical protein
MPESVSDLHFKGMNLVASEKRTLLNIQNMNPAEKALTEKILKITTLIQERYPELVYELEEYNYYVAGEAEPQEMKENPEVNISSLSAYYESLKSLLENYLEEKDKKDLYTLKHL